MKNQFKSIEIKLSNLGFNYSYMCKDDKNDFPIDDIT